MTKTMIIVLIIIVIGVFVYMKYFTNNWQSITGNNYDKNLKKNETNISELQKRVNEISTKSSFKIENCNELIIQKYNHANDDKPKKEFSIKDINTINEITSSLNTLPEDGEEFRSFIPTIPYTILTFICSENKNYKVEIYSDKLKTPGTTFFGSDTQASEKKIIDIINNLLKNN